MKLGMEILNQITHEKTFAFGICQYGVALFLLHKDSKARTAIWRMEVYKSRKPE